MWVRRAAGLASTLAEADWREWRRPGRQAASPAASRVGGAIDIVT
jgi:hypothetical protein